MAKVQEDEGKKELDMNKVSDTCDWVNRGVIYRNWVQREEGNNKFSSEYLLFKVPAKQLRGNVQHRAGAQARDKNWGVINIQVFV